MFSAVKCVNYVIFFVPITIYHKIYWQNNYQLTKLSSMWKQNTLNLLVLLCLYKTKLQDKYIKKTYTNPYRS